MTAVHYDNVAGERHVESLMKEQIIARGNLDRDGRAEQLHGVVGIDEAHGVVHAEEAVHLVVDIAGRNALEGFDEIAPRTSDFAEDPIADCAHENRSFEISRNLAGLLERMLFIPLIKINGYDFFIKQKKTGEAHSF